MLVWTLAFFAGYGVVAFVVHVVKIYGLVRTPDRRPKWTHPTIPPPLDHYDWEPERDPARKSDGCGGSGGAR